MEYICKIESPVGILTISSDGENILGLWLEGQKYFCRTLEHDHIEQNLPVFEQTRKWLKLYFSGREPDFSLPVKPKGSAFQKSIWSILCEIPFGQTRTYGEIAKQYASENIGKTMSARATGGAIGKNPISIIIPCHRVIGSSGALTGYAGGINKKIQLLQLEGINGLVQKPVV